MADQEISPQDYEKTLNWFYEQSFTCPIQLKATCAPHYFRIFHQRRKETPAESREERDSLNAMTRGCMGGISFCFISHTGQVQPCGFLEIDCGQLKEKRLEDVWNNSPVFTETSFCVLPKHKEGKQKAMSYLFQIPKIYKGC